MEFVNLEQRRQQWREYFDELLDQEKHELDTWRKVLFGVVAGVLLATIILA